MPTFFLAQEKDHDRNPVGVTLPLTPVPLDPLPKTPLVSILISNYNYAPFLPEAIESCLRQTYPHLEIVVCDDGSTDGSQRILEHYHSFDARIKPIYQANGGQSFALNAALRNSTGEIICLLDGDDIFLPEKVELVVKAFAADSCSGFAVNRMRLVDKTRKYLGPIPLLYDLPSGWRGAFLSAEGPHILLGLPPTSGLSLRRLAAEAIFPLPVGLKIYSDSLIQVLAPLATSIVAIETPLSEYRVHGDNLAGVSRFTETRLRNIATYEREIWSAWRRYLTSPHSGLPPDFPLPSTSAPSLMEYAYARFRSDKNSKAIYQAVPHGCIQALPRPHQLYWKVSPTLPDWLFRKSFDFVYGQTRLKIITRRLLMRLRDWPWLGGGIDKRNSTRANSPSAVSTKSQSTCSRSESMATGTMARRVRPMASSAQRASFDVLGVNLNATQIPDVVAQMEEWICGRGPCHCIAATSMHGIVEAQGDPTFKRTLNTTDLNVPDGMPLIWMGRRQGHFLPRRVYGPDVLLAFCKMTDGCGYRHFFYGGEPGVAEKLAKSLQARFPGLRTVGTLSPPFRPLTAEENENIVNQISNASPDIVWVGLGTPKQERWMHEHKNSLRVPVLVGVGAAFNILAGRRRQAPRWMREHGLEWLFRLLQEPRRLWRRYLIYGTQFTAYLLLESLGLKKFPPAGKASNS